MHEPFCFFVFFLRECEERQLRPYLLKETFVTFDVVIGLAVVDKKPGNSDEIQCRFKRDV
jgi:hypothetical protein